MYDDHTGGCAAMIFLLIMIVITFSICTGKLYIILIMFGIIICGIYIHRKMTELIINDAVNNLNNIPQYKLNIWINFTLLTKLNEIFTQYPNIIYKFASHSISFYELFHRYPDLISLIDINILCNNFYQVLLYLWEYRKFDILSRITNPNVNLFDTLNRINNIYPRNNNLVHILLIRDNYPNYFNVFMAIYNNRNFTKLALQYVHYDYLEREQIKDLLDNMINRDIKLFKYFLTNIYITYYRVKNTINQKLTDVDWYDIYKSAIKKKSSLWDQMDKSIFDTETLGKLYYDIFPERQIISAKGIMYDNDT